MDADEKMRIFIGLPVPLSIVESLQSEAETLESSARRRDIELSMVAPATYHVTLQFLGAMYSPTVDAVAEALAPVAGSGAVPLAFNGMGAFPSEDGARVLWSGVDDSEGRLEQLRLAVAAELEPLGFYPDDRPFSPHVTLARLSQEGDVSALLGPWKDRIFGVASVSEVVLYDTVKVKTRGEYERVATYPL